MSLQAGDKFINLITETVTWVTKLGKYEHSFAKELSI